MKLIVEKGNLFEVDDKYNFAHCISSDYALGAGIAVQFQKSFKLKQALKNIGSGKYPDVIYINGVFNLVTKKLYWHKPTYESITKSLEIMRDMIINLNQTGERITHIAMPKIGCGLDRLQWAKVKEIISEVFNDMNIEILVRYL